MLAFHESDTLTPFHIIPRRINDVNVYLCYTIEISTQTSNQIELKLYLSEPGFDGEFVYTTKMCANSLLFELFQQYHLIMSTCAYTNKPKFPEIATAYMNKSKSPENRDPLNFDPWHSNTEEMRGMQSHTDNFP